VNDGDEFDGGVDNNGDETGVGEDDDYGDEG